MYNLNNNENDAQIYEGIFHSTASSCKNSLETHTLTLLHLENTALSHFILETRKIWIDENNGGVTTVRTDFFLTVK